MTQLRNSKKFRVETNFKILLDKFSIDIVLAIIIAIGLFVLALYLKSLIGDWIKEEIGYSFNYLTHNSSGEVVIWYLEIYNDAEYYYESYLEAFRYNDWNPYVRSAGELDFYVYGPIYIYGLWFISLFVGVFNPSISQEILIKESVKWTAITFEALTIVMLYVMIIELKMFKERRTAKHVFGTIGAIALIFAPMNLLYVDAYYLNIPQMLFFTMLSIYLFMKEKYIFSACVLTLAWFSKQMPLFLLIPLFFLLVRKENVTFALRKFMFPFIGSSFLFSIPWIFMTPHLYIIRIIGAGRPLWYLTLGHEGIQHGVTLAHSFLHLGIKPLAYFYFYINFPMLPFIFFYFLSILIAHFNAEKINTDETYFILLITWIIILTHAFISRGLFKYYGAFFSPFLILTALMLLEKAIQIYKEEKSTELIEEKTNDYTKKIQIEYYFKSIIFDTVLIITFLSSIILIFYYEWVIMITIRFLHPLWLAILFLILLVFFPLSFYKSIFISENYMDFEKDFISAFRKTKEEVVYFWKRYILRKKE